MTAESSCKMNVETVRQQDDYAESNEFMREAEVNTDDMMLSKREKNRNEYQLK